MSGWKVVALEYVKHRRSATSNDESDRYANPNYAIYEAEMGDAITEQRPIDYIQEIAVEDYDAHCEVAYGTVLVQMGGYHAPWEALLEDTYLAWDRAVVIEANDTGDVGCAHVFDRTWDGSRNTRSMDLPLDMLREGDVLHGTRHDAIGEATIYDNHDIPVEAKTRENGDRVESSTFGGYDLDVAYLGGDADVWMVYADEWWENSGDGAETAGEYGTGCIVNSWTDCRDPHSESFDYDRLKVDYFEESELEHGRPVGSLAASWAHSEWGVYANANVFELQDSYGTATTYEWRYKVCVAVDAVGETYQGALFGDEIAFEPEIATVDHYYHDRHEAAGTAAVLDREHADAWVEAVPVRTRWTGAIATEFDPTQYPPYDPALDTPQRPAEYRQS